MTATDQIVSKSAFAAAIGRTPGRITQLIAEGKITPPALTNDGKINVALAKQQLKDRLDPAQQLGLGEDRAIVADDDDDEPDVGGPPAPAVPGKKNTTDRYLDAKAEEKELDVEAKRRRMAAESGRWMETVPAERAFAKELNAVFTDLEAWVMTCGQDLADAMGVDQRTATLTVRASLHKFRAQQAAKLEAEVAGLPETVADRPAGHEAALAAAE